MRRSRWNHHDRVARLWQDTAIDIVTSCVRAGGADLPGPLGVLQYSHALSAMVATLVAARVVSCAAYLMVCLRLYPELGSRAPFRQDILRQLLSFGGWMTLSNIAAPLLLYVGRFALAVLVSVEAVAYFSTPYDVVIKGADHPGIIVSVMFPMFASNSRWTANPSAACQPVDALQFSHVASPLGADPYALAKPAWHGGSSRVLRQQSTATAVMQLLGNRHLYQQLRPPVAVASAAYGRPDLTAKLHVAELLPMAPTCGG